LTAAAVFLDTSAWLAALSVREERHTECAAFYDRLAAARIRVVTTSLVMAEMHGLLVHRRGVASGLTLLDLVRSDPSFDVVQADIDLEARAIDGWLRRHPELPLSLTDAVSFEAMRGRGVRQAFTLDRHFEKVGFRVVPSR
jgi:predicted nucleic acid-binding protein